MYIATLFNNQGVFQRIVDWKEKASGEERYDLDVLLFRATSAYMSLLRMNGLNELCIEQYHSLKSELTFVDDRIIFWSPTLIELLNEFSPFLSSLRIMQNLILPLAAKAQNLKVSIPPSLAEAMKKLNTYGFSEEICKIVEEYCSNSRFRNHLS